MTIRITNRRMLAIMTVPLFLIIPWVWAEASEAAFTELYYYEVDRHDRYTNFIEQNPGINTEDAVWMVNSELDMPFYGKTVEIEDLSAFPLLVNKYNRLPQTYEPPELVPLESGRLMAPNARDAFERMRADAEKEGYKIRDVSAYRSHAYQSSLYNRYLLRGSQLSVDSYSARAGHSEHQTGMAVDLAGLNGAMNRFGETRESVWVNENAYRYGFIVRYPPGMQKITGYIYEPWHITYVGETVSSEMREFGIITLEEYKVKHIDHSPGAPELYVPRKK